MKSKLNSKAGTLFDHIALIQRCRWSNSEYRRGFNPGLKILSHIAGNAGDFLGAALPGNKMGMKGGTILVKGNVGERAAVKQL